MSKDLNRGTGKWNARFFALTGVVLAAAGARLLPHPPNVTPVAALALFSGAYFANKKAAFAVPLAAMLLSDLVLGLVRYGAAILPAMPFVYGSFALTVCLGLLLRRRRSPLAIGAAALAGSVLFFVLSNFGVWLRWDFYPKTLEGLARCYVAAIPFFRNTLAGDLVYVVFLFGGFALAQRYFAALRATHAPGKLAEEPS